MGSTTVAEPRCRSGAENTFWFVLQPNAYRSAYLNNPVLVHAMISTAAGDLEC